MGLLGINNAWAAEIRRRAQERFGIEPDAFVVHVTQNHAAPSLGHGCVREECDLFPDDLPWLRGGDDRYNEPAVKNVLDAIDQAIADLGPVTAASGRGIDGRVAFNRRFVMRDGTAACNPPPADPEILYCEGPADPEVGVTTFSNADGKVKAILLHHTCHPAAGYPFRYTIADWPGVWGQYVRRDLGQQCVPVALNGCCGNINAPNFLRPTPRWPDWDYTHIDMAEKLTETTHRVLGETKLTDSPIRSQLHIEPGDVQTNRHRMMPMESPVLKWKSQRFAIPMRPLEESRLEDARKLIAEHPEPIWLDDEKTVAEWDWVYAVSIIDLSERLRTTQEFVYEVQVVRIGNTAIVALIGEPFVEAQLRIKLESPADFTFIAHMCNGYVGYIPTRKALKGGGYETETANWSCLAPEASEMIEDRSIALIKELFEG